MPDLKFPDTDYLRFNPCEGDMDVDIRCRKVKLVKARREHACFMGSDPRYGDQHTIKPGDTYRDESALVDGDYWGRYKVCVPCMDKWLTEIGRPVRVATT